MKSAVWGNVDYPITQEFGINSPEVPDSWYTYARDWGYPAGTHIALDVGIPLNTPLYAPMAGEVIRAGENLAYNRPGEVVIQFELGGDTCEFISAHMNTVAVSRGSFVKAGQYIGTSGEQTIAGTRTPDGSGPHGHFEYRNIAKSKAFNPAILLTADGVIPHGADVSAKWVGADKINSWIAYVESANNASSPVHGMGDEFVKYAKQYGIDPAVVTAILQRESRMGADGSRLPEVNNFAGITSPTSDGSSIFVRDRWWQTFPTPGAGIEAVFKLLDSAIYRNTGGKLIDVMHVYAPPDDDNDYPAMFATFRTVGEHLGVTLNEETNIYSGSVSSGGSGDAGDLINLIGASGQRIGAAGIGVLFLIVGLGVVFAKYTPVGRVVSKAAKL